MVGLLSSSGARHPERKVPTIAIPSNFDVLPGKEIIAVSMWPRWFSPVRCWVPLFCFRVWGRFGENTRNEPDVAHDSNLQSEQICSPCKWTFIRLRAPATNRTRCQENASRGMFQHGGAPAGPFGCTRLNSAKVMAVLPLPTA